jgi:hypothetical protein
VKTNHTGSDSYSALDFGWPSWALEAITGKSAGDYAINTSNPLAAWLPSAWNVGQMIVLCSMTNPSSTLIVPNHCYAVVAYNASNSYPFEAYNPWGTDSSGWAPYQENGHQVYGLFWASATYLTQNFSNQSFGTGAMREANSAASNVDRALASASFSAVRADAFSVGAPASRESGLAAHHSRSHAALDAIYAHGRLAT